MDRLIMEISESEQWKIYNNVIDEYNTTPLATKENFICVADKMKFLEITELVAALPSKDAVLLDIGTGMGIAPRFFRQIGCRCITVDNLSSGGEVAINNAAIAGIETIKADICRDRLPLENEFVDCILFADVIEHLLHSPKLAIGEFVRVLKPNGVCVASTPNALRLSARIRLALGYSNWPVLSDFYDVSYHAGHHHEYTPSEFRQAFEMAGLNVRKFVLGGTVASVSVPRISDLQSKDRGNDSGTHLMIGLAKIPIWFLELAIPNFRPSMLLVAQKIETSSRITG